jgi:hypothetical protein
MIWYKRLESGTFEIGPLRNDGISLEIDHVKLSMLLSGIDIASAKRRKRFAAA